MRTRHLAIGLVTMLALLAVIGPLVTGDPYAAGLDGARLSAPSWQHLLGTDQFGRDVLARLGHGARLSLGIATIAIGIAACLGLLLGVVAGGTHGPVAAILSRGIDLALALPRVVVLLVLVAVLGTLGPIGLGLILGATGWPTIARLTRGEAQAIRHAPHVTAARALGATPFRRLMREVLPGTLPPVMVAATLGVADVLLLEAGLSFLGIGIRPPTPTWGGMLLEAQPYLASAPWLLLAPAVALITATAAATIGGDVLRSRFRMAQE
ncbi:MAG TPA: ABC transporter permease [Gemmatimonadales bacterium]|nr:ABC transporter permease [Gemmatimonadales bacterium]